jgi:acyl phosphate:glycerol-3-phosphate acyltransferase
VSILTLVDQSMQMRMSLSAFVQEVGAEQLPAVLWTVGLMFVAAYLIGSIPFAYIIVRTVAGEDITEHGTGNVGAMNVRRTTGSWGWFAVAMVADALKGLLPTLAAVTLPLMLVDPALNVGGVAWSASVTPFVAAAVLGPQAVVLGAVIGHNYSLWLSIAKRRVLGGKGLATGGGALIAYNWQYFLIVLVVGLTVIAVTRYMMAGQVAAALSLPVYVVITGQPDMLFVMLLGGLVYLRHHKRFVGLLQGKEPRLYVEDRMGPRG